jgi:branched-chain amino acid transport system substrate-binding protein
MRRKHKRLLWKLSIIVIIVIVLLVVFLPRQKEEGIKIGAILPLTGDLGYIGEGQRNSIELAINYLKDQNIQLIIEDDHGCQSQDAVTAAQKLINIDKVDAIIGATCSSATLSIAPIAEGNKVILISPSASSPSVTDAGYYIFRVFPADDLHCMMLAKFTFDDSNLDKAAILFDSANDAFIQERDYIKAEFTKLGGKIVVEESFKTKDTDFRTQLLKIKNSEVDVVFFSAFPAEIGLFLKQAKELDLRLQFISLDTVVEDPNVVEIAKGSAEGVIYAYPIKPKNKEHLDYITAYKERYGTEAPAYSAEAYDSLVLAVKAVKESDRTKEDVKTKLYQIGQNYMGASGEITFDENGDVQKEFILKTIKDGQFVPYEE